MARRSSKLDELRDIDWKEHKHKKWEIDNFKMKIVTFIINFGRNNIIRNRQMQVLKSGFGIRGISFIKLEF